jgi:purine-binding chemotaxis protein CheW
MANERVRRRALDENRKQYCTFWLSGRLYGVDILDVKEVNPDGSFTEVPHAPKEVCGFVNIRGQIHLILDLRMILGLKDRSATGKSRLVLFKPAVGEAFGVLVDMIGDVVEVEEYLIETSGLVDADAGVPVGEDKPDSAIPICAVCRLEEMLLLIVNARSLLKIVERAVAS